MKKKEEIKQLDKLWKNMKKQVKAFLESGDQEALHQFRIQVKKLKAMLTLYALEPDNQALLKHFKPVKKVFKKAGDVRNAYINLKLGEKYQLDDPKFSNVQQENMNVATNEFKKKGSKYLKTIRKTHILLQNEIARLRNKTIRRLYQDKLVEIDTFFTNIKFNDELHNARKNIKLLMYNRQIAANAIQDKLKINYTYLDKLQSSIGEWHDHNLTIEVLSDTGKAEDRAIKEIKNSNAALEKTILEQSNNFKQKVEAAEDEPIEN